MRQSAARAPAAIVEGLLEQITFLHPKLLPVLFDGKVAGPIKGSYAPGTNRTSAHVLGIMGA